ncbi:hypothetical protein UB32_05345 [Mesobacillus subterraneus]|uniref:Uncharacterized protein n=1 Tax=Mesobacillus subterraneus TaxID=285983 RepID=A0A0D6ZEI0_9BACI|nr:hypothetical protein UB32_05345 [Mesobacillus subterraneus]
MPHIIQFAKLPTNSIKLILKINKILNTKAKRLLKANFQLWIFFNPKIEKYITKTAIIKSIPNMLILIVSETLKKNATNKNNIQEHIDNIKEKVFQFILMLSLLVV